MAREAGVTASVYLVGVRGYYHDDHEENDRGIYDDALFLVTPQSFVAFNANVDPSVFRRGIAKLKNGLWSYKVGTHGLSKPKSQQYTATSNSTFGSTNCTAWHHLLIGNDTSANPTGLWLDNVEVYGSWQP